MLWGHTLRSPHAHARIVEIDISRGADDGRRARRADPRRRAGREDVRPRVPRPAGARAPTACATTASRSRSSRPSIPSRRAARPRRSASSTRSFRVVVRHGARDRDGAAPRGPADDGPRLPRRPAPERRPPHGDPPRRPGGRGRRDGERRLRRRRSRIRRSSGPSRGSPSRTARAASTSTSRPSGCTSTATRSPRASASRPSRCGSTSPASAARSAAARTSRCRLHGALLALHTSRPVKIVYNREESFVGHIHRHPARIWCEHRATRDGRLVNVQMRILLDGGAYASSSTAVASNAASLRGRPLPGRQRADRGHSGLYQ